MLNVIIRQAMEKNNDSAKSLNVIMNVVNNPSYFRDTPHRWPDAALPFAYAMACVEVVSQKSEKASVIYRQIIDAWDKPGIKNISEEIFSEVPESDKEKIKQAFIHPESAFLPDANKPFNDIEEMFTGIAFKEDAFKEDDIKELSTEEEQNIEDFSNQLSLILEFIIAGFNREADIKKGRL